MHNQRYRSANISANAKYISIVVSFFVTIRLPPRPTLFPYTTLFRSSPIARSNAPAADWRGQPEPLSGACVRRRQRRSEEHTSELQSRQYLVCRLLLEKKKRCNIWYS